MKYILLLMNGMAFEVDLSSYENFDQNKNNAEMLFHNFRDVKGVIHTVAKMSILSVAMESGLSVKLPSLTL